MTEAVKALELARELIQEDRTALVDAHYDHGLGRVDDAGQEGVDRYDAALAAIDAALAVAPAEHPVSEFVRLVREAVAASKAAPVGTAVPLPPEVTAEFHKFLRDEPSVLDEIPWGEFRVLVPAEEPQQRPALVDAMRGLLASLSREPTEQELRAAAHEFTVRADRLAAARTRGEDVDG